MTCYFCALCNRYHTISSKIGRKHLHYAINQNPVMSKYELLHLLSPSEVSTLMRKLKVRSVEQLIEKLPEKLEVYPDYYANPEREAKICIRVGRHKICFPPFKIKTGIWPKGLFKYGSVEDIIREALKQIRSGTPYATVVHRINLVRVWNKRDPVMWEKLTQVLEKLKEMHKSGLI